MEKCTETWPSINGGWMEIKTGYNTNFQSQKPIISLFFTGCVSPTFQEFLTILYESYFMFNFQSFSDTGLQLYLSTLTCEFMVEGLKNTGANHGLVYHVLLGKGHNCKYPD